MNVVVASLPTGSLPYPPPVSDVGRTQPRGPEC
jgi:hypothetical protein